MNAGETRDPWARDQEHDCSRHGRPYELHFYDVLQVKLTGLRGRCYLYFVGQQINLSPVPEENTISIFQGCSPDKHPWKLSLEPKLSGALLIRCADTPEPRGEYVSFFLCLLKLDSSVELIILPSKQFFFTCLFLFIPSSLSPLPTLSTCLDCGDLSPETRASLPNPPSSHCLLRAQLWLCYAPDQKLPAAPPTTFWPKIQFLRNTAFLIR